MSYKPSISEIKALRERSGAGLRDVKNALIESGGDIDGAFDYLRKRGIAKAQKKAGRVAADGLLIGKVEGSTGVLAEINCETDFAAGTDAFIAYANAAVEALISNKPTDIDAFQACTWADGSTTVEATQKAVFTIGENIRVRRFHMFEAAEGTHLHYYIHGKRLGTMVEVKAPSTEQTEDVLDEICLHIVSTRPEYINSSDIPSALREKEETIQFERAKADEKMAKKPDEIIKKMINGRIIKWTQSISLMDQEWYEEKKKTAKKLKEFGSSLGGNVVVNEFACFGLGEGIQKKENNFADEVASMSNS